MSVKPLWTSPPQFVDANGDPYSGAYLFFYAAGSSTKQDTFTSSTGGVACPNPITLNASGYPAISGTVTVPWGTVGQTYKIGLAAPGSSDPPNSFIWSADNISPVNDTTVAIDQWVSGPAPTYVSGTSFTLVGDQTSTFTIGRRLKTTNSGGTIYSTITNSAYGALTTITVVNDSGVLDSGLSAVSYALLSAANISTPATALRRASIYQYTAWDPSDVAGTYTNASSTAAATLSAASYVTVANSSGTLTFTAVVAGLYRFTITGQNEYNAALTLYALRATIGGTGTAYLGTSILQIVSSDSGLQPLCGTGSFYANMTAGQTVTILPAFAVTSGGVTTNFTQQCTVSAEYCGT